MLMYTAIKFLHILLAIMAVGFNASYAIWIMRAAREPEHIAHTLRGIQFLDDRLANPGYGLLLITGLAMVFVSNLPLTTFWIDAALALWLVALVIGIGFYTPALRRQLATLESKGVTSMEYQRAAQRSTMIGIIVSIPVVLIVALMVFKPIL